MASHNLDESICGNDSDEGTIINARMQEQYFKEADPLKDNLRQVEKGRLDRKTGRRIPLSTKALTALERTLCPSQSYLNNFDQIKWNEVPIGQRDGYTVKTGGRWYA